MATPKIQSAFSAGEISPELYGEVDLAKMHAAATTLRNMIVNYKGGALSRGGLAYVGRCKQPTTAAPPRPIPFQFSITQGYILEFGDNYIRFVFDGGYVLESPVAITGVTNAVPAVVSLSGTPFNNGDWVFASGVGGMTELNGQTFIVVGVGSGSLQLEDLNGNPLDSTGFGTYTSGGTLARLYTISSPYAAVDLPYLKFSQSADVMSLTLSNPLTGTEYPPYDLTRLAADDWTLTETDFDPVIAPPSSVSAAAQAQAPTNGINATFAYVVTAVDAKGNESIASAVASCHGADLEVEAGTNAITWAFVSGAQFYNVYRAPASVDTGSGSGATPNPVPAGSIFGFVGSSYGTQFLDTLSVTDLSQVPPTHQNPFAPGQILAVEITGGGSGQTSLTYSITTVDGMNFVGTPVLVGGSLGGFLIANPGEDFAPGDTIAFNGAGFASGAIHFTVNPSANDTITLNGVVWTFVTAITGPQQTLIAGATAGTLAALVSNLSASANPSLTVASYAADVTNAFLLISYNTAGTAGNSYTLASSNVSNTVSGATLTGGSGSGSAGTKASGSMTFGGNPTNGQNIVLDGVTWTFVTSGATGPQTNLGVNLAATLTQLQLDLTASANANIQLANYAVTPTALDITYKVVGTIGNSYTLGAGTASPTLSAPTLTGGANASTVPTATLEVGPTSGTYPGVNAYFQERHFFANSLNDPDTFWASVTALYKNFDTRTPSQATDAIQASPWTEQVNGIQWLIPMPGGLIAMTGSRAWQIIGEGSYNLNAQPITPSSVQAQPQAFNGCSATLPPIVIDFDVLFLEALESIVRDMSWNFWTNIYTGTDLTILSSHLFLFRQIVQWAWARNPYKVLWCQCNDGTMLSLTYMKEQEVYGWARHDTQGLVVGVASVSEPPVNAVYAIVQRFPPNAGIPGGLTYVMEAKENYDPANVALIQANTAPLWLYTDSQDCGMQFDFLGRNIVYATLLPQNAPNLGIDPTGQTTTNNSGFTLWDGVRTALGAPGTAIANGAHVPLSTNWNLSISFKNIDTDAVTTTSVFGTSNVPNGLGPAAYGYIQFSGGVNPTNGQNIVLNGVTWTFVTGTPSGAQTKIQASLGATIQQLAWDLNASANASLTPAYYQYGSQLSLGSSQPVYPALFVTYKTGGTGGNAYTLNAGTVGGTLSASTLANGATASDGTWLRMVGDSDLGGGNVPLIIDPRTKNVWIHMESCEIYLFRESDSYKQIISPYNPVYNLDNPNYPIGITSNWFYAFEQNQFGHPNTTPYANFLHCIPSTITSPEVTLDKLLSYADYDYPSLLNSAYFRHCLDHSGNFYVVAFQQSGTRDYRFWKFTAPVSAPWGGPVVGGGFTDITPWGGSTGPNTNAAGYTVAGVPFGLQKFDSNMLMFLPATQDFVAINFFAGSSLTPAPSDPYAATFYDCTYINVASSPTFDYHHAFVSGYMSATWAPSNKANGMYAVNSCREHNVYLGMTDYEYSTDYTTRWFMFSCKVAIGGGSYGPTRAVLVQYKFVSGAPPQVLQVIDEEGWDNAYPAYATAIGDVAVVLDSMVNPTSGNTDIYTNDCGLYDPTTNSFWWSGANNSAVGLTNGRMYYLNSYFTPRATMNHGFDGSGPGQAPNPPFLKLSLGTVSGSAPGVYMMERMDNRLWQSVEDAYAVDAGISNPMASPAANLYASTSTGPVTFTASANVFTSAAVGQALRMAGGIATISTYLGPAQLTGTWVLNPSNGVTGAPFAASGDWTLAAPVTTLYAPHLTGMTGLVGLADGVPINGLSVADDQIGTVTLPFTASDVKIGLSFTAQMQTPYLNGPDVMQGARKAIPAATVRIASSGSGFQYGTNQPDGGAQNPQQLAPAWTGLQPGNTATPTGGQVGAPTYQNPASQTVTQLWTGDLRIVGGNVAGWNSKGQCAIQQTLPLPLEVTAVVPEILMGDTPEQGYQQRAPEQGSQPTGPSMRMLKGGRI